MGVVYHNAPRVTLKHQTVRFHGVVLEGADRRVFHEISKGGVVLVLLAGKRQGGSNLLLRLCDVFPIDEHLSQIGGG